MFNVDLCKYVFYVYVWILNINPRMSFILCMGNPNLYVFISSVCYIQTCIFKYSDVYPPLYACIFCGVYVYSPLYVCISCGVYVYLPLYVCIFTPVCMYIYPCMYVYLPLYVCISSIHPWPVKVLRLTDCLNSEWWRTIISTTISFRFTFFSTQSFRFVTSELICYERCGCLLYTSDAADE